MTTRPYNIDRLRTQHEQCTGLLAGFVTDTQLEQFQHVVVLRGLTPQAISYDRFRRRYLRAVAAAVRLAPCAFVHYSIYENHARVGYEFRFEDALTATRFRLAYAAACANQPCPTLRATP